MNDSVNNEEFRDSKIFTRRMYFDSLYDFYSPLLTENQRKVYETLCFSDLTPTEAGKILGMSRQAVHDLANRVMSKLEQLESKLHFVATIQKLEARIADLEQENFSLHQKLAEKEG